MNITCTECGRNLEVPDEFAGQLGSCNHCHAKIKVPKTSELRMKRAVSAASGLLDAVAPVTKCAKCDKEGGRIALNFVEIGIALYCPDCAPLVTVPCPKCDEKVLFKNLTRHDNEQMCKKCADKAIEAATLACNGCGEKKVGKPSYFARVKGELFCRKCLQKNIDTMVTLTTTNHVEGCRVKRYISIESVEFVIGTGIFSEFFTSFDDFFGQRSSMFESKLGTAKKTAMDGLKYRALSLGGNAVIGIDIDYTEFTGNRVALIINGTVVEIEPIARSQQSELE